MELFGFVSVGFLGTIKTPSAVEPKLNPVQLKTNGDASWKTRIVWKHRDFECFHVKAWGAYFTMLKSTYLQVQAALISCWTSLQRPKPSRWRNNNLMEMIQINVLVK